MRCMHKKGITDDILTLLLDHGAYRAETSTKDGRPN